MLTCSFAVCGIDLEFDSLSVVMFVGWTVTLVLALVLTVVAPALVVVVVLFQVQIQFVKKSLEPCDMRRSELNTVPILFSADRSIWLIFTLACRSLASYA